MTTANTPRKIPDVVCTACGCLCDDIVVHVAGNRVVAADHACPIGASWLLHDHDDREAPTATIEGRPSSVDDAVERAAEILAKARSPLILGLTRTSVETQRAAVSLADGLGAAIDPASSADSLPRWLAVQRVGMVSATLGEIRNRADVVVFWGLDPVTTHPRHMERYSVGPVGRFVPEGRAGRTVIVVDDAPSPSSAVADRFVRIVASEQAEVLATLRAIVRGVEIPDVDDPIREMADTLKTARYGAFFFGAKLGASAVVEEALKLVRDLNASTRFVALTMGAPGNAAGAESVMSWQAGSPVAVDFVEGFPRFLPDSATAEARLSQGLADAAMIVADDPRTFLSSEAMNHLDRIPTIAIGPEPIAATVVIRTATPGIHEGGTVMRCDGATLPLRPLLTSDRPTARDILMHMESRWKAITS